jgi:hypothetical protein
MAAPNARSVSKVSISLSPHRLSVCSAMLVLTVRAQPVPTALLVPPVAITINPVRRHVSSVSRAVCRRYPAKSIAHCAMWASISHLMVSRHVWRALLVPSATRLAHWIAWRVLQVQLSLRMVSRRVSCAQLGGILIHRDKSPVRPVLEAIPAIRMAVWPVKCAKPVNMRTYLERPYAKSVHLANINLIKVHWLVLHVLLVRPSTRLEV